MANHDKVVAGLERNVSDKLDAYRDWHADGGSRLRATNQLFRVLCNEERVIWNQAFPLSQGVVRVDAAKLREVYGGGNGYARKWFVFNRPYLFGSQRTNEPRKSTRERKA